MKEEEKELIERARQGENLAFEQLIQRYDRRVMALALQLLGNRTDAEDVCQEVFMKVYQKIHQFQYRSEFYTWLYRIAVNCAITYRKKRRRYSHTSIDATAEDENGYSRMPVDKESRTDAPLLQSELQEQIQSGMENLSLMQRTVFVLRFYQDFKIKEIAQIIGCTEGTVKNYLFRSTQKIRKKLTPYIKDVS